MPSGGGGYPQAQPPVPTPMAPQFGMSPPQGMPAQMAPPPPMPGPANSPGAPTLAAFYAGQKYIVNKDRFIIGRGKQSSDLTIKDPNVSRQHAMVEFANGQFYMVDMGSTNGVEYNGQRVTRKVIGEGDLFRICDHELRFSYR
jgi:pSer/pThr/pTyr-binding forkhead associated (FHA) protein